jgi:rhodanese-related sulfurtransferase
LGIIVNEFHPKSVNITWKRPPIEYAADTMLAYDLPEATIGFERSEEQASEIPIIVSTEKVIKLISSGMAILLDVRDPDEYEKAKIEGALNLPYSDYDILTEKVKTLPHDKWIICYCDGPQCDLSESLALELINYGFNKVAIYKEGLEGWQKSGKIPCKENQHDAS